MTPVLEVVVGGHCLDDLEYAEDALLNVVFNERFVPILNRFEEMHPYLPKKKIQNLGAGPSEKSVTIGGVVVESVDEFVYLCSLQSGCLGTAAVVRQRMGIAAGSMRSHNHI